MLAEKIERTIFTRVAPQSVHYVRPVAYKDRSGLVAEVYDQMMRDFQLVPPLTVHSPVPPLLAGVWSAARESLVAGPASRVERESVASAVSRSNTCPFCVDVHTTVLHGAKEHTLAKAIARGDMGEIQAPRLRSLVAWGAATRSPGSEILRDPPFSRPEAPQIVGSALFFHYINRVVNVFLDESPLMLPAMLSGLKGVAKRLAGALMGRGTFAITPPPGDSLSLLAEAKLPADFAWAAANPPVAGAWARFAAAVEDAGRSALPGEVRDRVAARLEKWTGEEMPLGSGWPWMRAWSMRSGGRTPATRMWSQRWPGPPSPPRGASRGGSSSRPGTDTTLEGGEGRGEGIVEEPGALLGGLADESHVLEKVRRDVADVEHLRSRGRLNPVGPEIGEASQETEERGKEPEPGRGDRRGRKRPSSVLDSLSDLLRLIDQHHRDAVLDRILQLAGVADEAVLVRREADAPLALGAAEYLEQLPIDRHRLSLPGLLPDPKRSLSQRYSCVSPSLSATRRT
jgi:AhpD family alkylhydroperoxidase